MKDVLTRIAWKNHRNGANRGQFRKEVPKETIAEPAPVAGSGTLDCSASATARRRRSSARCRRATMLPTTRCT